MPCHADRVRRHYTEEDFVVYEAAQVPPLRAPYDPERTRKMLEFFGTVMRESLDQEYNGFDRWRLQAQEHTLYG